MKIPVIIDTDPGFDDALAIMLAVKSDLFKIKAITTVAGNSGIENTTRNARYILKLLDKDIPVFSGSEKPIKRKLVNAVVHGQSGLAGLAPDNDAKLTGNAVDKILSLIENSAKKITLITLGPLTNIARAIKKSPDIMSKVKEIVIMGGAIKSAGNQNRVAEFNIFVDPEAADIVFNFDIKKTLIPLDACSHIKLSLKDFEKIKDQKLREPILSMIRPYIDSITTEEGVNGALMYDPLTIYSIIRPQACQKKYLNIMIETKGSLTRGMTVADLRKTSKEKPNVSLIEIISENKFKRDFINILSK